VALMLELGGGDRPPGGELLRLRELALRVGQCDAGFPLHRFRLAHRRTRGVRRGERVRARTRIEWAGRDRPDARDTSQGGNIDHPHAIGLGQSSDAEDMFHGPWRPMSGVDAAAADRRALSMSSR
jgi:hypothetical protein